MDWLVPWGLAQGLQAVFVMLAIAQHRERRKDCQPSSGPRHAAAMATAGIAAGAPVLSAILLAMMIFGGGSPVAQLTGNMQLWSMWCQTWPLLMLGNAASVLALLVSLGLWLHPRSDASCFFVRATGLAAAVCAFATLAPLFPDA